MKLEIFSNVNRVDYPSIEIKIVKNGPNVDNVYFLEREKIRTGNVFQEV